MEGIVKEITFKEEKPWNDIVFYNYNVPVDDVEKGELKGFLSSANKKTTIGVGDRIRYELKETQFGIKFDKPKIVPTPIPSMFPATDKPIDPLPTKDRRNVDVLKVEALKFSVDYWDGKTDQDDKKIVETAKIFFGFLMKPPDKSLDLPF